MAARLQEREMDHPTPKLDELAEAFITMFGTSPTQETPPGKIRDEQLRLITSKQAILTGYWAMRLLEELLYTQELACVKEPEDRNQFLLACLAEGLRRWDESPFDGDCAFWKIVTDMEPDAYFQEPMPAQESSFTFITVHLLPLVVRRAMEGPEGPRILALAAAREEALSRAVK